MKIKIEIKRYSNASLPWVTASRCLKDGRWFLFELAPIYGIEPLAPSLIKVLVRYEDEA